jgi:hypothetical protein
MVDDRQDVLMISSHSRHRSLIGRAETLVMKITAMKITPLLRTVGASAVVTALALAAPTAASAETGAGLQAIKDAAHAAITARVTSLNQGITVVNGSTVMGADQATRRNLMQSDINGLQQLDATIQADTTAAQARADANKVFTDYRIYALVIPVTHQIRAADEITTVAVPKFNAAASTLQGVITQQGRTDLQPTLDDMKAQVASAQQATNGLAAQLEGYTPAQWNSNHALLTPSRTSLENARTALRKARQDAKTLVSALLHK